MSTPATPALAACDSRRSDAAFVAAGRSGMTVIELLVTIGIIVVLMGLLVPAIAMARRQAYRADARQTVSELGTALDLYRRDEPQHRYPAVATDLSLGPLILEDLDRRGLWSWGNRERDAAGALLDPWGQPYRYSLTRPAPGAGASALLGWNWDRTANREARWSSRRDDSSGNRIDGPLPYPYLWSLGPEGLIGDATGWLFMEDGK